MRKQTTKHINPMFELRIYLRGRKPYCNDTGIRLRFGSWWLMRKHAALLLLLIIIIIILPLTHPLAAAATTKAFTTAFQLHSHRRFRSAGWEGTTSRLSSWHALEATRQQDDTTTSLLPPSPHQAPSAAKSEPEQQATLSARPSTAGLAGSSTPAVDQLQRLKDSVDIVSVIETYRLDKFQRFGDNGRRATAICPFHNDHHPSLSIDGSRQMYKCFACGAGGDVVRFVQEYSKLPGQTELTFGEAIRYISTKFGDGTLAAISFASASSTNRKSREEQDELWHKKERVELANAAAAAFYTECFKEPFAGGARYHLMSRGIGPATIRAFAMGFAPDVYYGARNSSSSSQKNGIWGEGSLVVHLKKLGFTATEIFDAGLATRTKYATQKESANSNRAGSQKGEKHTVQPKNGDESSPDKRDSFDYSSLMDRFRARLVVPILDDTGKTVLGFGGREISPPRDLLDTATSNSDFKIPKYLNSPESIVFEKKKILFGRHMASQAMRVASGTKKNSLLIVEGYMDAISLWDIGFHSVVASMGTAISPEQLDAAAKTAGSNSGQIVLCLDNDDAGTAAIERLCTNGMLADVTGKNMVDVLVAKLPYGIKDPAEFTERRREKKEEVSDIASVFRQEVVDTAVDWTEWMITRIVGRYDGAAPRGSPGSFNDIFEKVADFLARSLQPADRTKRAYEVSDLMAQHMAKEQNATEISSAVRIQLESDLIEMASRVAGAREATQRRIDSVGGLASVSILSSGFGQASSDDLQEKLSVNVPRNSKRDDGARNTKISQSRLRSTRPLEQRERSLKPRRAKLKRRREPESLTPHFAGFQFAHQTDREWLGLNKEMKRKRRDGDLLLGQRPTAAAQRRNMFGKGMDSTNIPSDFHEEHVYFNSANFNGLQFLTDAALKAGYTRQGMKRPDASLIQRGVASLVEPDIQDMMVSAEDALLRVLLQHSSARTTVKNMLEARNAVSSANDIEWSCPAKSWLFDCLVGTAIQLPLDFQRPGDLRSHLATLPSVPKDAFGEAEADSLHLNATMEESNNTALLDVQNKEKASSTMTPRKSDHASMAHPDSFVSGVLDPFFTVDSLPDDLMYNATTADFKSDFVVQEIMVTLLWCSAAMKVKHIREQLESCAAENELSTNTGGTEIDSRPLNNSFVLPISNGVLNDATTSRGGDFDPIFNEGGLASANVTNSSSMQNSTENFSLQQLAKDLPLKQTRLLSKLQEATRTLHVMKESAKRITARLLDESSANGIEGHISAALLADLFARLDDHFHEIGKDEVPPEEDSFYLVDNDEPYEVALERMAEEWGEWFDDDYFWSPSHGETSAEQEAYVASLHDQQTVGEEIEESMEDFDQRIEKDWGDFYNET